MKNLIFLFFIFCSSLIYGQSYNNLRVYYGEVIGSQAQDQSAILDVQSTYKGFLTPRMTTYERSSIISPATGLMIYNTTTNAFNFYNGSAWTTIGGGSVTGTATQIPYFNATGNLTTDSRFYRDSSNTQITLQSVTGDTTGGLFIGLNEGAGFAIFSNTDTTYTITGLKSAGMQTASSLTGQYFISVDSSCVQLGAGNLNKTLSVSMAIDTVGIRFKKDNTNFFLDYDVLARKISIGDYQVNDNGTFITVDDLGQFIKFGNIPAYADDATAVGFGLTTGMLYQTTTAGSTYLKIIP